MNSVKLFKLSAIVVCLLEFIQFGASHFFYDTINQCQVSRDASPVHVAWQLTLRCSPNSKNGITSAIRANTSTLHCAGGEVNLTNVLTIKFDDCELSSLAQRLLKNFKNLSALDLSDLSLDILREDDLPVLVKFSGNFDVKLDLSYI